MACQLLRSAAIIICKMPQTAIAQIGHDSLAVDTIMLMRRPPGRSSIHWNRIRHVTGDCSYWP